jgi:hypothetical protein
MASDVIKQDGIYQDKQGNRFQFRKDHVLGPGEVANLTRVGDFPEASGPGAAEYVATQPTDDEKAKADADAKAKADAKAAPPVEDKAAAKPENKSA